MRVNKISVLHNSEQGSRLWRKLIFLPLFWILQAVVDEKQLAVGGVNMFGVLLLIL